MPVVNVTVLAGGVGGARMSRGFAAIGETQTTVVVNVADDSLVYGLHVSPDIDSVVYALAGLEGPQGWGRSDDTWRVMAELSRFPIDTSFRLGDQDLAMNLYRTHELARGVALSEIVATQCDVFGIDAVVIPATDDIVRTFVQLDSTGAWIDFQTYFVRRGHQDRVRAVRFDGIEVAGPAPGVLAAIGDSDVVVFAPSNPIVSIDPILALAGVREALTEKPVVAVSPFVGGSALKGPAAELMDAFGRSADAAGLADHYTGLIDRIVVHRGDGCALDGIEVHETDILIPTWESAARLAEEILAWVR